jgi:hypothetical protein
MKWWLRVSQVCARGGSVIFIGLVWLGSLQFPAPVPGPGLEQSWQKSLLYFHQHRAQAGKDYVFGYGPLGYLLTPAYERCCFSQKLAWEFSIKFLFALACWSVGKRLTYPLLRLLLAAFLVSLAYFMSFDLPYVILILILTLALIRSPQATHLKIVGLAVLLAILSLVKLTLAFLSLGALVFVTLSLVESKPRWRLAMPLVSYVAAFVLIWLMAGQHLANLPSFVSGSLQIASGYNQAMTVYGKPRELVLSLTALTLVVTALATLTPQLWANPKDAAALGVLATFVFVQWKHGFVRHDLHSLSFFAVMGLVPFLLPAFCPVHDWKTAPRAILLAYAVPLSLAGIWSTLDWPLDSSIAWQRLMIPYKENFRILRNVAAYHRVIDRVEREVEARWQLPRISARVKQAPIDLVSFEQAVLVFNRMNWRPRPVFQSYSAYTPALLRMNAQYFRSERAPEYVLFKLQTIDQRLPTLDDGPALLEILARYRPVFAEKSYLLLERHPTRADSPASASPIMERTIQLGEEVSLDNSSGRLAIAKLTFEYSLLGKIRNALYKPRPLQMWLRTGDNQLVSYRIVPEMSATGFLLSPLLQSDLDVLDLYHAGAGKSVVSFRITGSKHAGSYLKRDIKFTLEEAPRPDMRLP